MIWEILRMGAYMVAGALAMWIIVVLIFSLN